MAKKKQEKEGLSTNDKLLIVAAIAAILVVASIAFVLIRSNRAQVQHAEEVQRAQEQSSLAKKKKQKDSITSYDDQNTASVTQEEAEQNISDAIPVAFETMQKLELVSGESANIPSLPAENRKKVLSYFTTAQVFQNFNDNLNVSVQEGKTTYGDAGTGLHTVKRPTPKTSYKLDKLSVQLKNTTTTEYNFSVDITYHPKGFDKIRTTLSISVDRSVGKISKVEG